MRKSELIKLMVQTTGIETSDVTEVLDAFIHHIRTEVKSNNTIHMRGFGSFSLKHRKAKKVRHIPTNEEFQLPARHVPHFKPSKQF